MSLTTHTAMFRLWFDFSFWAWRYNRDTREDKMTVTVEVLLAPYMPLTTKSHVATFKNMKHDFETLHEHWILWSLCCQCGRVLVTEIEAGLHFLPPALRLPLTLTLHMCR